MRYHRKSSPIICLASVTVIALAVSCAQPAQAATSLVESGSSLLYPLFNLWVQDFSNAEPSISVTTTSTGSGTGIAESIKGLIQVGASDAYLSNSIEQKNPSMLSIPLAISAQSVNYNLPGLNGTHLKFSGPVLAGIYTGKITNWDDPQIAALNPGISLPNHAIVPVHRNDGSGDTFIFSQYLSDTDAGWKSAEGFGTSISWPAVSGGIGATGNPGMVSAAAQSPYTIAYIGVSFRDEIAKAGLGTAELKNKAGNFVLPTHETIAEAAASLTAATPADERISLVDAAGAESYPIINYEYAIINAQQPDAATADSIKTLLNWALTTGNEKKYLKPVHFVALPAPIVALSKTQIAKIQ